MPNTKKNQLAARYSVMELNNAITFYLVLRVVLAAVVILLIIRSIKKSSKR